MGFYQFAFYVPETHLESVKQAIFAAGAGVQGDYQNCAWQIEGRGQFQPMPGSDPFIGEHDRLEQLNEYKVEVFIAKKNVCSVMQAFFSSHPYEEPAYYLFESLDARSFLPSTT